MTRELDIPPLRLLVLLAEQGSLGKASRQLGISQPAASNLLKAFEARWQLQLADRSARGTRLTDDGETVAVWARELLTAVESVRHGLLAMSSQRRDAGVAVGIAASLTVAEFVLPRWIAELRRAMPTAHPQLRVVNSNAVGALISRGECEIGFIETSRIPADLHSSQIGSDQLTIVVSPSHSWGRRSVPLAVAEVLESEFVVREPGSGTRETFAEALGQEPAVAMVASSTTAIVAAAIAGVGPAVISRRAVGDAVERGQLIEVEHGLDLSRPLTAVWRRDRPLGPAARTLLAVARRPLLAQGTRP